MSTLPIRSRAASLNIMPLCLVSAAMESQSSGIQVTSSGMPVASRFSRRYALRFSERASAFISFFFRFPAGAPYPVTFTFRSSVPSSRRMFCNALRSRWYISKFCLLSDNSPSVFSPFSCFPLLKYGMDPVTACSVSLPGAGSMKFTQARYFLSVSMSQAEVRFSGRFSLPAILSS